MTGLAAYLVCVTMISALACGHQAQDFPPTWIWHALRNRHREQSAPRLASHRPVPSWAHTEPYDYDEAA
ncbi:hypothetical protein [Streptomyces sp. BBFR109]|uniref:hypothetical protein n=1 Tax=Streptomyces sp. BBFR109 TaxID=3448172 RepID=UPI003F75AAF6